MSIIDEYLDPIISTRRKIPEPYIPITENWVIKDNRCLLSEIPDKGQKVQITDPLNATTIFYEIPKGQEITNSQYFTIDYTHGIVTMHSDWNDKELQFSFHGTGLYFVPSSRIWTEESNGNVTQTLKQLVNETINNEETRQANELIRQSNETERQTTENNRISNEDIRQLNETTRENQENTRQTNESTRQINETDRVNAENIRNTSENERVTNESARESNETTRITTENQRIEAENLRGTSELTREDNEILRQNNEQSRIDAENIRLINEDERILNEANRDLGYQNMLDSSKFILKTSVDTFNDIATTYTDPANGWAVRVVDTGKLYRFNGVDWIWVDTITATVFDSLVTAPKYFWIEEKSILMNGNSFEVVNDILPEQEIRIVDLKYGVEWLENVHWTRIGKVFTFTSIMPEDLTFRITNLG